MPVILPSEPSDIRLMVIGEGPGSTEDEENNVFVGRTGKFLREHIPSEWLKKVYWTNSVRCRPPDNRTPTDHEVTCCSKYLKEDLAKIQPHAILGVGNVALSYFQPGLVLSNSRGIPMPVQITPDLTAWYLPVFHPSYVGRSYRDMPHGKMNPTYAPFVKDLNYFFNAAADFRYRPEIPKEPIIHYPKSYDEAISLFNRLEPEFAIDLETHKKKPYLRDAHILTASFSDGNLTFAVPVWWPGILSDWGIKFFKWALTQGRRWTAHSSGFELSWIWSATGQRQQFDDTRALARVCLNRKYIFDLGTQSQMLLGFNVKKMSDVNSAKLLEYPLERVLKYNALDAWATALIKKRLKLPQDQVANYERIILATESGVNMELLGLDVNLDVTRGLTSVLKAESDKILGKVKELPEVKDFEKDNKRPFVITSNKIDVPQILIEYYGAKLRTTEKGNYSVDEPMLESLADDIPLARLILENRGVDKLKSTYVDPILLGTILGIDGKLHPVYKSLGTVTGRLSSEDPNFQNWPVRKHREVREQIVAPPGHILVSLDYGQLEARVLAMASGDVNLSKAIITKEDIHGKWLKRILQRYPAYEQRIREQTGETEPDKIFDGGRTIIKFDFVFASFYNSDEYAFASRTGLPLELARDILHNEFWKEYAGVRAWMNQQFKNYDKTGVLATLTGYKRDEVLWGNEPINSPIQGTAAHIVLEGQIALFKRSLIEDPYFAPRANVHDDLTFILPDNNKLSWYIEQIAYEMVKPRFPFITIPLMVECKIGYNWGQMEKIKKWEGAYFDTKW